MGAPVRESDDSEPSKNEPLKGEPPKSEPRKSEPRKSEPLKNESLKNESLKRGPLKRESLKTELSRNPAAKDESKNVHAAPSSRTSEAPEPPWKRKTRRGVFEGDVAVVELRSRLAQGSERIWESAAPASNAATFGAVLRLMGGVLTAAAVAGVTGYLWGFRLSTQSPQPAPASDQATVRPVLSTRAASLNAPPPSDMERLPGLPAKSPPFARASNQANGVPAPPSPAANLRALNADFERPSGPTAAVSPAPVDARGSANNVTSFDTVRRLMPPPTAPRSISPSSASRLPSSADDASDIAAKMKIGAELMANGDIAAARMMFERTAEAGNAAGAFALAETYDPVMLRRLRLRGGVAPDVALARRWYERARDLGSIAAPERISRLAQIPE
jgi:hypothetical protein